MTSQAAPVLLVAVPPGPGASVPAPAASRAGVRATPPDPEGGMVTAETAAALPALLLVLALAVGAVGLTADTVRCIDAARVGARAAARGDDGRAVAVRAAPAGSAVTVDRSAGEVAVAVVGPRRAVDAWLPESLHARARAVAAVEPAGDPP